MAASAHSGLWEIALGARSPAEMRAALLRMQADLFVSAPSHDLESRNAFETLSLGLLQRSDHATARAVTRILALCGDTPVAVLDHLVQRVPEERSFVATKAPRLSDSTIDLLIGSAPDRAALAARSDLDDATLDRLVALADQHVDEALARNITLDVAAPAFVRLVDRARQSRSLAGHLLARSDLPPFDEAALYLSADPARRTEIRTRLAASILFERARLAQRPEPAAVEALLAAAAAGASDTVEAELTAALHLPSFVRWRVLEADRHDLLALGLRAAGFEEETAVRVFLTIHPVISHSVATVFALARTVREVARPIALTLVEAILGSPVSLSRSGRHQPFLDPSGVTTRPHVSEPARRPSAGVAEARSAG
jgi:hypothetical protein